jgi:hypothetical protein
MNKKLVNIALLFLVVITTASCKKWLSLQPQDGITREKFWQTKEQVQSAVFGCYASLLGDPANRDRQLSDYLFMWGELRADMIAPATGISNDELDVTKVNTLATNTVTNWAAVYRTINYCNTVIDYAPGVLPLDNTLTQTQLNSYLAEAHALRALMYFYLVRSFRDVPLKITATANDDDLQQLPKSTDDVILAQIVSDLAFADSNAVFSYGNNAYNKGRITKYTVKAIEADVFLWMEKYNECIAACDFIISSGQFGLIAGNGGWFSTLYYNGNSNESIFEFQYDVQKLNNFFSMFTTSGRRYLASQTVLEEVYTLDFLDDTNKDIRGEQGSVRSDNTIYKFLGVSGNALRTSDVSYAHWFVYRYADILLMKAEAANQLGDGATALALVKVIRNRAHALPATDKNPITAPMDPTDKNGIADFILEERAREFAFEGKRWYDILRNAKRNNYQRINILYNMVAKTVPAALQQSAIGKYSNKDSHYFPIYTYELQSDPNLVQNPFYR